MRKYRVKISRHDIKARYEYIDAQNDKEAKEIFNKKYKNTYNYSWDDLVLEKIVQQEIIKNLDFGK